MLGLLAAAALTAGGPTQGVRASDEFPPAPAGELTIDGQGPFAGTLGTSCVTTDSMSGCSDAPWLTPSSGPSPRANADMAFELGDGSQISSWQATYGDAAEPDPDLQFLDEAEETDTTAFSFSGPPTGDWVVSVYVRYHNAEATGDATYYFRVHAGMPETDTVAPTLPPAGRSDGVALALLIAAVVGAVAGWRLRREPGASVSR